MIRVTQQHCEACGGSGFANDPRYGTVLCVSCGGSGWRNVPAGYTQAQIEPVREIVDAMVRRARVG